MLANYVTTWLWGFSGLPLFSKKAKDIRRIDNCFKPYQGAITPVDCLCRSSTQPSEALRFQCSPDRSRAPSKPSHGKRLSKADHNYVQRVNAIHSQFKTFLRKFDGVSTNYLVNDINWFLYLEKKASNNVSFFKNFVLEILTDYNARGLYGQFRLTGY